MDCGGVHPTLNAFDNGDARAVTVVTSFHMTQDPITSDDVSPAPPGRGGYIGVDSPDVRRLTPTECERLQGFPDDHTAVVSDSQRYRQMGNAVSVPVIQWIAERINEVDDATDS